MVNKLFSTLCKFENWGLVFRFIFIWLPCELTLTICTIRPHYSPCIQYMVTSFNMKHRPRRASGAEQIINPNLSTQETYSNKYTTCKTLIRKVISSRVSRGMNTSKPLSPSLLPQASKLFKFKHTHQQGKVC